MNIFISKNEILSQILASWIAGDINVALKTKKRYAFVLSGGTTPGSLYEILAKEYKDKVDWQKVDFFWGDERYVRFEDERNNGKMAYETLLTPLGISAENIFRIPTSPSPEKAASQYEQTIREYFASHSSDAFDLALLGMGGDGHTLSVFPGSELLEDREDLVKNVYNPRDQLERITMLPHVIKKSGRVVFMIKGTDKSDTLRAVLHGELDAAKLPSQLFRSGENVIWFVDEDAADKLVCHK